MKKYFINFKISIEAQLVLLLQGADLELRFCLKFIQSSHGHMDFRQVLPFPLTSKSELIVYRVHCFIWT